MKSNIFYAAIRDENGLSINEAKFTMLKAPLSSIKFGANGYSEKISAAPLLSYEIAIAGISGTKKDNFSSQIEYYQSIYGAVTNNLNDAIFNQGINLVSSLIEPQKNCYLAEKFEADFIVKYTTEKNGFSHYNCFGYVWDAENKCVKYINADDYAVYDFVNDKVVFLGDKYGKLYRHSVVCARENDVKFVVF